MYKVTFYLTPTQGSVSFKWFKTLHEATMFANKRAIDSIIEIKYYESSDNNGPTLRGEERFD